MKWWMTMQAHVILPELGAAAAFLSVWFADPGDEVYEGDRLVEIRVNGATFDVPAPATGRLLEKHVHVDEPLAPGQVLGVLDVSGG
jgi:pyruvate/2-oxoglutarate dehydrogenase complex dihydrolipoamide acyltransferase (E2) component